MNKGMILAFSLGAAVGAVASWGILKTKYENTIKEVIESMEEVFSKREKSLSSKTEKVNEDGEKTNDISTYEETVSDLGYSNDSANTDEKEDEYMEKPYVIPPEDFDVLDGYTVVSLTYYDDGVLTDDYDEIVDNVDELVGYDFAKHFGEYEDDSVYVRNDALKTDYEILYDQRKYSDVHK